MSNKNLAAIAVAITELAAVAAVIADLSIWRPS